MSRELLIAKPLGSSMDSLRSRLDALYSLSRKVEGLGELETIDVATSDGKDIATIEISERKPRGLLARMLRERAVNPDELAYFWIRIYDWRRTNELLMHLTLQRYPRSTSPH